MTVKISVTQQHIDRGLKGSCTKDPIALACQDAGMKKPFIGPYVISDNHEVEYYVPEAARQFMKDYDNDKLVFQFDFELEGY